MRKLFSDTARLFVGKVITRSILFLRHQMLNKLFLRNKWCRCKTTHFSYIMRRMSLSTSKKRRPCMSELVLRFRTVICLLCVLQFRIGFFHSRMWKLSLPTYFNIFYQSNVPSFLILNSTSYRAGKSWRAVCALTYNDLSFSYWTFAAFYPWKVSSPSTD